MPRKLVLLGAPHVSGDGAGGPLPSKAWLLFALLALAAGRTEKKTTVAGILFPSSGTPSAALRQLVHRIHGALANVLRATPTELQLGDVITDVEGVISRRSVGDAHEASSLAATAPLLEGIEPEEHEAAVWLHGGRRRVRGHIRRIVLSWAETATPQASVQPLLTLLQNDPDDTVLAATTVDVLLRLGRRLDALRVVETYAEWRSHDDTVAGVIADLRAKVAPLDARVLSGPASLPALDGLRGIPRIILLRPSGVSDARGSRAVVDSFVEDLSIEIAASQDVAVIAANTAWRIAEEETVAERLPAMADFALRSSMRLASPEHPVVAFSLLKTGSRDIVWAQHVVLNIAQEQAAYDEILKRIVASVIGSIEKAEVMQLRRGGLATAYRAYLVGRHYLRTLDLRDIRRARRWFRNSAEIDPNYARAHSWLGHTLVLEWLMMTGRDPDLLEAAVAEARLAIELDPLDPNGHRVLARARLFEGFMDESLEGLDRAEKLGPHFADLLADYADTLAHHSAAGEAKAKIDLAISLNPIPPDTYLWIAGGADFALGDFASALENLRRVTNKDQVYRLMAASAAMLGDEESAYRYRQEALSIDPSFEILTWIQRLPIRRREHLELYVAALRKAGFR